MVTQYYNPLLTVEGVLGYISDEKSYKGFTRFNIGVAGLLVT